MEASGFLSGGDAAGASVVPTATVTTVLEVPPTIAEENAAAESTPMLNALSLAPVTEGSPFTSVENFVTFAADHDGNETEFEQDGNVATFASRPATPRVSATYATTTDLFDAVFSSADALVDLEVPSVVEVTLTLPPVVPEDEYVTRVPGKCLQPDECIGPLPEFTTGERLRHKVILAQLCATRASQKAVGAVMRHARCPSVVKAGIKSLRGCVSTDQTCGDYFRLENEAAELLMLEEAQRTLKSMCPKKWAEKYTADGQCPWPVKDDETEAAMTKFGLAPSPTCSVRLICSYEEHLRLVRMAIVGARSHLIIMSCYFFANEAPFVNVVKNLLPDAAKRGVRVRLLLDALPAQSALVKAKLWGPATKYAQGAKQRLEFLKFYTQTLPDAVKSCPPGSFRVAFFKAFDKTSGHAIKSHMKMFGADGRLAVVGGSNMLPTAATGANDCDLLVDGDAARALDANFAKVWAEQTGEDLSESESALAAQEETDAASQAAAAALARAAAAGHKKLVDGSHRDLPEHQRHSGSRPHPLEEALVFQWHERSVRFVDAMSRPGTQGEDAILRGVIGLIDSAKTEFLMCMGFCALHVPLVNAMARASRRGVRVRLLLNSHFSCDLRPPMSDLIAGARALLLAAPDVELYLTGPREPWDVREEEASGEQNVFVPGYDTEGCVDVDTAPYDHPFTFVHAKYCVADRARVSLGSWNAWARSAFHEAEMNLFLESGELGTVLAEKWGRACSSFAARVRDADALAPGGGIFAPRGCKLCTPFGGFVGDAVERAMDGSLPLDVEVDKPTASAT